MPSSKVIEELENQDWPFLIKAGTLHAVYQLKYYGLWNRRGIKGYSAEEIAMEAIEKIYTGEWKWNPEKSSLLDYLKYHVIRGIVSNLAKSSEFQTTYNRDSSELFWVTDQKNEEIIETVSQNQIIASLRKLISSDNEVMTVFEELLLGFKRSEICEKYKWENKTYDNASRRLGGYIRKFAETIH